jgi:hypothetical protein
VVLGSSRNFIVSSLWKKMRRVLRSHFRKSIASVCHVTMRCEHVLFLHECFLNFVFRFVCDGWQNLATCLHPVLREAFCRTLFKPDTGFWMTFMFQGGSSVSWSWKFRVTKHRQKYRKCCKDLRPDPWRLSPTIHELADPAEISYGVRQEILTENLKCAVLQGSLFPDSWQVIRVFD